ncbi:MAG: hypothetical protein DRP84_01425 [Spirochaetes bacterium]|nr:MAG: hypothetical protein DRP84_01425 [Spirochaetota bacterium]
MSKIVQIRSQIQQLVLFSSMFSWSSLCEHIIFSPFDYYSFFSEARFPLAINFLVTSGCNLKCKMCNYRTLLNTKRSEELRTDEIKDFFIREHKKKFHVILTGGEPFIREDIFEIIETIKQLGLTCGIITNGTLITGKKVKYLIELKIDYIIFSLLGPREIHDSTTGMPGSFDLMINNIRSISSSRKKTKIFINSPVTYLNMPYLKDIIHIAEDVGVDALRFEQMNFITEEQDKIQQSICAEKFPNEDLMFCTHKINNNELKQLKENAQHVESLMNIKGTFKIPVYFKPFLNVDEMYSWYSENHNIKRKCLFVWKSLFINPCGDVLPCQFLISKMGNIKQDRLEDIWNNAKYKNMRKQLKESLLPVCLRCCKL